MYLINLYLQQKMKAKNLMLIECFRKNVTLKEEVAVEFCLEHIKTLDLSYQDVHAHAQQLSTKLKNLLRLFQQRYGMSNRNWERCSKHHRD